MRVLVVADNVLARTGLAALLAIQHDVEIVGQVAGTETIGDDLDVYRPEVVAFDLGYDPAASAALLPLLEDMPVVALLPSPDDALTVVVSLPPETPYGLMLRDSNPAALARALHAVCGGLIVLDPPIAPVLIAVSDAISDEDPAEKLTPREYEVLQLMAEGLPNKLIAQRLQISPNTVKFHINAILSKLEVQSRTEAVIRATRLGWVML